MLGAFTFTSIVKSINLVDIRVRKPFIVNSQIVVASDYLSTAKISSAERDREYLKQLRRNRDEEAKLMANVPGWEVGTWYGEPVYKTLPKDTLVTPLFKEFYAHTDYKSYAKRAHLKLWS